MKQILKYIVVILVLLLIVRGIFNLFVDARSPQEIAAKRTECEGVINAYKADGGDVASVFGDEQAWVEKCVTSNMTINRK